MKEKKRTQIGVKLSTELRDRLKMFMIVHHCETYEKALKALLDAAEKRCIVTDECICTEWGEEIVKVY
jgi:hypothetical protein